MAGKRRWEVDGDVNPWVKDIGKEELEGKTFWSWDPINGRFWGPLLNHSFSGGKYNDPRKSFNTPKVRPCKGVLNLLKPR